MQTWPTATLVHLPVHASWLNQVEIYFSILQRKAISPNDFADLDDLSERIIAFQHRYNTTATPFDWSYTQTTSTPTSTDSSPRHPAHPSPRRITPEELTTDHQRGQPRTAEVGGRVGWDLAVGCWLRGGPSLPSDDRGAAARLGAGQDRLGRAGWRSWRRW